MLKKKSLRPALALLTAAVLLCFRPVDYTPIVKVLTLGGLLPGIYARGLFWFAFAPFLACGVDVLARGKDRALSTRMIVLGLLAYAGLSWADYQRGAMVYLLLRKDLLVFYGVIVLLLLLAASAPRRMKIALVTGLAALVLAPLADQGLRYPYFNRLTPVAGGPPAIAALRAREPANHARMAAATRSVGQTPCLSPDLASLWRVRDVRVVDVLLLRRFVQMEHSFRHEPGRLAPTWLAFGQAPPAQLGLLAVRYYGIPLNPQRATFRWEEVPDAMPRAYLVHSVVPARDEADSLNLWEALRDGPELHSAAILEGWRESPAIGRPSSGGRVSWIRDGLKQVELKVETPSPAVLVLLDAYANGWVARVDGRRVPIFPANLAFRGVKIPPGSHVVSFRYQPPSVILGEVLAGAGWLAVLLLLGLSTRRRG
jgi:hypothetical protein